MIEELEKIQLEQKKFKNSFWLIMGILIFFVGVFFLIKGFINSKGELILVGIVILFIGGLLTILNKIGLNILKRPRI